MVHPSSSLAPHAERTDSELHQADPRLLAEGLGRLDVLVRDFRTDTETWNKEFSCLLAELDSIAWDVDIKSTIDESASLTACNWQTMLESQQENAHQINHLKGMLETQIRLLSKLVEVVV